MPPLSPPAPAADIGNGSQIMAICFSGSVSSTLRAASAIVAGAENEPICYPSIGLNLAGSLGL